MRWRSWIDELDLRFQVDPDEILDQLGVPRRVRRGPVLFYAVPSALTAERATPRPPSPAAE